MGNTNSNSIRVTEGSAETSGTNENSNPKLKFENFKKPLIYFLMAVACAGCLYLIFKPKDNMIAEKGGFNSMIPQAANDQLQADKQKAYEQQLLEQANEENKGKLTTLADYWSSSDSPQEDLHSSGNVSASTVKEQNALNSYRNAQKTLGSFYSRDEQEVSNLRKEINRLKNEANQKSSEPAGIGINDQLELMEKSYQMAAKYLPTTSKNEEKIEEKKAEDIPPKEKDFTVSAKPVKYSVVSSLYREPSDSLFVAQINQNRFAGIQSEEKLTQSPTRNSIHAVIHETKTLTGESTVSIRLSERLKLKNTIIPKGTLLKAISKFQGGRLNLKISSIEYDGNIIPVEINIYDNDGQLGLYVHYSPEQNALTDIAANMSQTSGTSIMMTQSAGQQIAADLSRGLVQGVSGYFQKKVRQHKITVKSGHQVFLVSKK
ncbi:conjugative transposon protein TraM [Chryseobacterium sp.]|uniref:conjugative transposon protein TraM n=1 Tax=Chryseobacterium sp. TaxID=1871047 RepID=UPI00289FF688|nr:conjugative transposon protein TraM [Chryseobacterium sp.]